MQFRCAHRIKLGLSAVLRSSVQAAAVITAAIIAAQSSTLTSIAAIIAVQSSALTSIVAVALIRWYVQRFEHLLLYSWFEVPAVLVLC
jgi:hypothetical protein